MTGGARRGHRKPRWSPFWNLEMAGQKQLFLAMEIAIEAQAEPPDAIPFLLTAPTLCFRNANRRDCRPESCQSDATYLLP